MFFLSLLVSVYAQTGSRVTTLSGITYREKESGIKTESRGSQSVGCDLRGQFLVIQDKNAVIVIRECGERWCAICGLLREETF